MATLQGQEIKDTYQALLKTDGNTNIDSNLQTITDGQGNASALSLNTNQVFSNGTISTNIVATGPDSYIGWYENGGGTSGSQNFLYNSANSSIYLNAFTGWYTYNITSSLTDKFIPGNPIAFYHSQLGLLTGSIESSYFYDGEGNQITIIKLTSDPSNGTNDVYNGDIPPNVYYDVDNLHSVMLGTGNTSEYYGQAEGWYSISKNQYSHAEGQNTIASGSFSHSEGQYSIARAFASHAEGRDTVAAGIWSHAEGQGTTAVGDASHAEGGSISLGVRSHAEGIGTKSVGSYSHTEGQGTTAVGDASHTEGYQTTAIGNYSHAEGYTTTAVGDYSHAEGGGSIAVGNNSHAEGGSIALGNNSHAEGGSTAVGDISHAEGYTTTSKGYSSHAEGAYTISSGSWDGSSGIPQHAEGRYNIPDTSSLLIVGNGTADNARRNAFTITTFGTNNTGSTAVLPFISQSLNYANDAAAAAGGVPLGGIYRSGSFLLIRTV